MDYTKQGLFFRQPEFDTLVSAASFKRTSATTLIFKFIHGATTLSTTLQGSAAFSSIFQQ